MVLNWEQWLKEIWGGSHCLRRQPGPSWSKQILKVGQNLGQVTLISTSTLGSVISGNEQKLNFESLAKGWVLGSTVQSWKYCIRIAGSGLQSWDSSFNSSMNYWYFHQCASIAGRSIVFPPLNSIPVAVISAFSDPHPHTRLHAVYSIAHVHAWIQPNQGFLNSSVLKNA